MGKFLRDATGNLVAIDGGLVLERILDRKPRDCESCGYSKWVKKDKVFIIQGGTMPISGADATATAAVAAEKEVNRTRNNTNTNNKNTASDDRNIIRDHDAALGGYVGGGSMEWICPDCAVKRGLPVEFYHKNFYAPASPHNTKRRKGGSSSTSKKKKNHRGDTPLDALLDLTGSLCSFTD